MNLLLEDHQLLLKDSAVRFVRDYCGVEVHRRLRDAQQSIDAEAWQQIVDLGWLGMPFSEADGGFGGSYTDVIVLVEELARGLVVQPYMSTVLICGGLLSRCGQEVRDQYLPAMIAGESQWAFAFAEQHGRYKLDQVLVGARQADQGYLLDGEKIAVLNGAFANHFLVTASMEDGSLGLFAVDDPSALQRRNVSLIDGSQGASLEFLSTPATLLKSHALALVEETIDEVILAIAAQALGSMTALLEMTVEYTQMREQFGQPIGKFQALQHRMADMYMHCEATRSMLYAAVIAHQEGNPERARLSSALKVKMAEAGRYVSQQAVQLHGGIGMSDELAVGHHFKALLLLTTLFGDADWHLDRYIALQP